MRSMLGIIVIFFVGNSYGRVEFYHEAVATSVLSRFVDAALLAYYEETRNVFLFARNPDSFESLRSTIPLVTLDDWDALTETMSKIPGTLVVFLDGDAGAGDSHVLERLRGVSTKHPVLVICNGAAECSSEVYFERIAEATDSPLQHYAFPDEEDAIRLFERTKVAEGSCGIPRLLRLPYDGLSVWPNVQTFFMAVNFNKCPILLATKLTGTKTRPCTPNDPNYLCGTEGEIVRLIVDKINATPVTTVVEGHRRAEDIQDLVATNKADLGYGHLLSSNNRSVQNSAWFLFLKGTILIPHTASLPKNLLFSITVPLEREVWFGIAVAVVAVLILGRLIPHLRSINPLQQLSLTLGVSVPSQPRRIPQRIYFLSIVLFGFVISQSYLVHLTKIFTASTQQHMKTPEELEKSGIPIYGISVGKNMLEDFGYTRLAQSYRLTSNTEFWSTFLGIVEGRLVAAVSMELDTKIRSSLVEFEDMESAETWYFATILMQNTSILTRPVRRILSALSEQVLSTEENSFRMVLNTTKNGDMLVSDVARGPKKLNFNNLQAVFILLGAGLTLSFVVFVAEFALSFFKKKSAQQQRIERRLAWLGERPVTGILLPLRKTPRRPRRDVDPDIPGIRWFDGFATTRATRRRI